MRVLIVVFVLLLIGAGPAHGADRASGRITDWFSVGGDVLADWRVAPPDADGRILIRPKAPASADARRVMVIYPRRSSAYDVAMTTLLREFANRALDLEFLVVNFGQDPARGDRLLAEAARDGYALIYAMGSETVGWIETRRDDLRTPVVTVCAKDPVQLGQMPDYVSGSGDPIAFTSLNLRIDVQVEYLRELKPALKNLAILVDAGNISAVETQARPIEAAMRAAGVDAFEVAVTDAARARAQLAALVPAAVARMRVTDPTLENSLFWITGSTSVFSEIAEINAHAGRVPVLSVVPDVVQEGAASALLSIGVSFESNAQLAAVYGAEILSGRREAAALPVGLVSPPDIAVNFLRARAVGMKAPFSFFETASYVYDAKGAPARVNGRDVARGRGGE